jgi:hypothetical protein
MNKLTDFAHYDFVDALVASGVPENQAKTHIKVLNQNMHHFSVDQLASKNDVSTLNTKIDDVEARLNTKIDKVEIRLNSKIDNVEIRLNSKIDNVEIRLNSKIDNVEVRLRAEIQMVSRDLVALKDQLSHQMMTHFKFSCWTSGILASGIGALIARDFILKVV